MARVFLEVLCSLNLRSNHTTTSPDTSPARTQQTAQPQTFTIFSRLPSELQIQIWEYAAEVEDKTWAKDEAIGAIYELIRFRVDWADCGTAVSPPPFDSAFLKQSAVNGYHSRHALLQTCRLARMLALGAWRADVENIIARGLKVSLMNFSDVYRVSHREINANIVGTLDRLIEEVRERL